MRNPLLSPIPSAEMSECEPTAERKSAPGAAECAATLLRELYDAAAQLDKVVDKMNTIIAESEARNRTSNVVSIASARRK